MLTGTGHLSSPELGVHLHSPLLFHCVPVPARTHIHSHTQSIVREAPSFSQLTFSTTLVLTPINSLFSFTSPFTLMHLCTYTHYFKIMEAIIQLYALVFLQLRAWWADNACKFHIESCRVTFLFVDLDRKLTLCELKPKCWTSPSHSLESQYFRKTFWIVFPKFGMLIVNMVHQRKACRCRNRWLEATIAFLSNIWKSLYGILMWLENISVSYCWGAFSENFDGSRIGLAHNPF